MIKKFLLFPLLTLIFLSELFSQSFSSNIFGQKLGPVDEKTYYVLYEENGIEYLKKGDEIIKKISRQTSDGKTSVTVEDWSNNITTVREYENGLLVSEIQNIGDDLKEIKFNYIEGSLLFCTIKENGGEPVTEYYIKDSLKGKLIGKKVFSDVNLSGTGYLIENDNLFMQLSDSVVINDYFEFDENGNIVYQNNDNQYIYSSNGQILEQNSNGINTVYEYDDNGVLIKSEKTEESVKTVSIYNNGIVESELIYENDNLMSIRDYSNPLYGMTVTIVNNGKEIADVFYDFDYMKIVKIEYRD